jgi:phosphoribosylformylglycinamidine synthase
MILTLDGRAAMSAARLERATAKLATRGLHVTALAARWVHVVEHARAFTDDELAQLDGMLAYGSATSATGSAVVGGDPAIRAWITPRAGTTSPWSSKATELAHVCGLALIQRIERAIAWTARAAGGEAIDPAAFGAALADRMTQRVIVHVAELSRIVHATGVPRPLGHVALGSDGAATLRAASASLGLALADDEIDYLVARYAELGRDPTDVELMMFAQANSEHCRHKIFNAEWFVDGTRQPRSLFQMIKRSTEASPAGVRSAYKDNAAVIDGSDGTRLYPDADGVYRAHAEPVHILGKVETHNHPTAISPFAGAATGSGGELRDEGATGRGGKPKAGLVGFTVSGLRLPGALEPWEPAAGAWIGSPARIASALEIMLDGPLGAAAFNNEFGRPAILGFFRTFEHALSPTAARGFHKPVMLAGGIGAIRAAHVDKAPVAAGAALIVLGGPAFLIGLGGGAASSLAQGASAEDLDFASVQRDNPEIERRCQEVIDRCWAMGEGNPILSIHDVGAGGLSNALPELVHDAGLGAALSLRAIPTGEADLSPLELWCNEAQERYVLAIAPERLDAFGAICARERAPWARVGTATAERTLRLVDERAASPRDHAPVDLPLEVVLGKAPRMTRHADVVPAVTAPLVLGGARVADALDRVLGMPAVADKSFLITIGDRTVGGLVARDPMVGPFQVPVADCALTTTDFDGFTGEVMALGERPPVALLDAAASARLAIGEAITNLAAVPIGELSRIKLSCNWMAAAGHAGEDAALFAAVRAAGEELAPALGLAIPVGKDSMSMRTHWRDVDGTPRAVVSPVTLIATAFGPVTDVRRAVTPELRGGRLALIALGDRARLGGSALAQAFGQLGDTPPDLDEPARLVTFFHAIQHLVTAGSISAYHDRSDGGLVAAVIEMAFAGGAGLALDTTAVHPDAFAALFAEELGAVIEVADAQVGAVDAVLRASGLPWHWLGRSIPTADVIRIVHGGANVVEASRAQLRARWSHVSHAIASRRDDPACAAEEHAARAVDHPLTAHLSFDPWATPAVHTGARPRVAIVREQGVNGQIEMAAAFTRAGFDAVDVHMTDLIAGRADLADCRGAVACGGFSFGDVLGAGRGWAATFRYHPRARAVLAAFTARLDTFVLGVCNGCQMLAELAGAGALPGAEAWPRFARNRSEQFEARVALLRIDDSPSIFFRGMAGSRIPIAVSHGEGRAELGAERLAALEASGLVCGRYVDGRGEVASRYPANPNGSPNGIAALTSRDGRFTILMPHPERVFRNVQLSWRPPAWDAHDDSPWLQMFENARAFAD